MRSGWMLVVVAAVAVVLIGGGCTSSGSSSATLPSGAGQGSVSTADAAQVWAQFVACARAHGQANWPDPVVDDQGRATFPPVNGFNAKAQFEPVRAACAETLTGLPPQANPYAEPPLSAQELDVRRRYAQCMREHGVADFPEPDANGQFHLPPGFWTPQRQQQDSVARPVCDPIRDQG